jgi:hypothetical protein
MFCEFKPRLFKFDEKFKMGLLKQEEQCFMEENLKVVWEQVFKFKLGRFDA